MLSPAGRCCALTGLLMTSDFDPDGAVKLRAFSPSGSGIAAASHLHESQGKNSCFLRSQPPQGPRPRPCGRAPRPRELLPRLPLPPPMARSNFVLPPPPRGTGVGGRPGPGSALGRPPSRQRPPLGCWAWWWWLEGVEPPVTGLHALVIPELGPHVGSPCSAASSGAARTAQRKSWPETRTGTSRRSRHAALSTRWQRTRRRS